MVVYAKNKNYFLINFKEAQKFAKLSGDFNPIHLDSKEGYNSLYLIKLLIILILLKLIKSKIKNYLFQIKLKYFVNFLIQRFIIKEFILIQKNK